MSFKDISHLELWRPLYLTKWNRLCNCSRSHHEEQFCEIILNLDKRFMRRCHLTISWGTTLWHYFEFGPVVQELSFTRFLIWSSGDTHVQRSGTIKTFKIWTSGCCLKEKLLGWPPSIQVAAIHGWCNHSSCNGKLISQTALKNC